MLSIGRLVIAAVAVLSVAASHADAVILYRSATKNTSAPTGSNANSGWQWQANWNNGFSGTPIASNYFITAGHVGGGVGQTIWLNGKHYRTTAYYDDPLTDLRIYKTAEKFASYAPIYTGTSETGKRAMIFGRGTTRGSEVKVSNQLKGWKHGAQDWKWSWGENMVSGTQSGGTGIGQVLRFTFNKGGLANEGTLSAFDSAGGVFINDAGKWKLAGINYLIDGPFSFTQTGATFPASLFDKGGLYQVGKLNPEASADIPGNFYATRISSRASWINSILKPTSTTSAAAAASALPGTTSVPEPSGLAIIGIGAGALLRRRRR